MVNINKASKSIETSFKGIEGSKVTLRMDLTGGQFKKVQSSNEADFLAIVLSMMITSWNLEDDNGPLEINIENINKLGLLDQKDIFLQTEFGKRSEELQEKKMKSSKVT